MVMDTLHEPETSDVGFNTFIGVLVSICGNILISVALNVQKRAHNKIQERQMANYFANLDEPPQWISAGQYSGFLPDDGYSSPRSSIDSESTTANETNQRAPSLPRSRSEAELIEHQKFIMTMAQEQTKNGDTEYLKSKLWWLGISLMILGEVGNFVAYGFAPASTIAPLGTTTLVSNVILAPLMLKEVFRKRDLAGVVLAVAGAAIVVFSSNSEDVALSPELIVDSLTQLRSIIYFIFTGVAIAALTILSPLYGSSSIVIDLGLVAIYGGYTVLSTKSVASLLSLTFYKMFAYPVSYVLILVLVVTAVLQIKYLNKALQRFDSTEVIPTQFVLFTVSAIVGSAVLYHDFDDMSLEQMSRFMSGCAIEFLGVYLITSKRTKHINSPALSINADSGTVVSLSDEEALDRVDMLPSEQQNTIIDSNRKRTSTILSSGPFSRTSQLPLSFEAWRDTNAAAINIANNHLLTTTASKSNRRHSSVFRGISMASQLLDRNDEQQQAIQLPTTSPGSGHRRGDSALGNLFSGITQAISSSTSFNHHYQTVNSETLNNNGAGDSAQEADAIEIEIPTPSSLHDNSAHSPDRELMPIRNSLVFDSSSKRNSKLISEEEGHSRDLS